MNNTEGINRPPLAELPDDPAVLKAMIRERDERIARHEHYIRILAKIVYGTRSEKLATYPPRGEKQLYFSFPQLEALAQRVEQDNATLDQAAKDQAPVTPARKHKGRRASFPEHLPRFRTEQTLTEAERRCGCGQVMQEMGEDLTQELERISTTFVHEIVRKKYSCRACQDGVRTAPMPHRILDRSILGPGMLAATIVDRFLFHMPYHRQEKKHESEGPLDQLREVIVQIQLSQRAAT